MSKYNELLEQAKSVTGEGDCIILALTTALRELEARVAELSSLLTEAVAEMEPDIESKYANVRDFPSMARKYEQDMDLPKRIRAALGSKP